MRGLCFIVGCVLLVSACSREQFSRVDFPRDEALALYRTVNSLASIYKFEWQFDRPTVTSVIIEQRAKGTTVWNVLSRQKEAATKKATVTVLLDSRPEVPHSSGGFLLRLGWGFEDQNGPGKGGGGGWGSRDVILPAPVATDLQWKCSQDDPEEMFSLSTSLNDYRVRIEKMPR